MKGSLENSFPARSRRSRRPANRHVCKLVSGPLLAVIGLAIAVVALLLFGYFFFMRHVDAPKAWNAADRELQGGMLSYGEKVERKAKVFMRRPSDYYRGANGMLY